MRLLGLENRIFDLKWHVWVPSQQGEELQWLIFIDSLGLNTHRNKYSGVSVEVVFMRVFLERKIHVECGQQHRLDPGTDWKGEKSRTPNFFSFCFRTLNTVCTATFCSCRHDFPSWWKTPSACEAWQVSPSLTRFWQMVFHNHGKSSQYS